MTSRRFHDSMSFTAMIIVGGLLVPCTVASAAWYRVVDLGPASPGMSGALAVDSADRSAGFTSIPDPSHFHAALWDGFSQELGALGADNQSNAMAFGFPGHVFGVSYSFGDIGVHAFLWQGGTLTGLGDFYARGANATDLVAGHTTLTVAGSGAVDHAVIWQSGSLLDLGTLGGSNSYARAVNNAGEVVGVSYLSDDVTTHAFIRRAGQLRDLGTLGGAASEATAINDAGVIVGFAETAAGEPHACRWLVDANGVVLSRTDLGLLGGGFSYANGINSSGRIVGISNGRACLWQNAIMDLNHRIPSNSGWFLTTAAAINNNGRIVGSGIHDGLFHGYMLVPAPSGDFDGDGDVDMSDFGHLQACLFMAAPISPQCQDADLDVSGQVNAADLSLFNSCATRAGIPADPMCGN